MSHITMVQLTLGNLPCPEQTGGDPSVTQAATVLWQREREVVHVPEYCQKDQRMSEAAFTAGLFWDVGLL